MGRPPKWAQAICIAWPFAGIYALLSGYLRGDAEWRSAAILMGSLALLLVAMLLGILLTERLAYAAQFGIAGITFAWFWPELMLAQPSPLGIPLLLLASLAAMVASAVCFFQAPQEEESVVRTGMRSRRTAGISFAATLLVASLNYANSFHCPPPSPHPADPSDLIGKWWGKREGNSPFVGMSVRMISFEPGGRGSHDYGFRAIHPRGRSMYWLMRGHRLHVSMFNTDAWSRNATCPTISADRQTLRFGSEPVFGVSTYYREGTAQAQELQKQVRTEQEQWGSRA